MRFLMNEDFPKAAPFPGQSGKKSASRLAKGLGCVTDHAPPSSFRLGAPSFSLVSGLRMRRIL